MHKKVITTSASVTLAAMLGSCTTAEMQQWAPAVAGVVGGSLVGGNTAQRVIAGLAFAMVTVAIINHYNASQAQRRYAESRAYQVSRSKTYATAKAKKNVRYVAVPVKKKSETEKSGLMVYDTEKGQLASDQVFVPKASSIPANSIVTVDGKKALLESGFDGS
jgi:hypothetical protein